MTDDGEAPGDGRERGWWQPIHRRTGPAERDRPCPHCGRPLGDVMIKVCPECGELFHEACYEDTEGGRAYATPGCSACFHRTYWR